MYAFGNNFTQLDQTTKWPRERERQKTKPTNSFTLNIYIKWERKIEGGVIKL